MQSADDYRADLDAACAELAGKNEQLPRIQQEQDLTIAEVEKLAEDNGDEFRAELEDLSPPGELEDEHQELLSTLGKDPPQDPDEYLSFLEQGADLYAGLAATGCEIGLRDSIDAVREAQQAQPVVP